MEPMNSEPRVLVRETDELSPAVCEELLAKYAYDDFRRHRRIPACLLYTSPSPRD